MAISKTKQKKYLPRTGTRMIAAILIIFVVAIPVLAQTLNFDDLNWFAFGGGGGQSSGGGYTISGTLGQHDTGIMSNGEYVLNGGFWAKSMDPSLQPSSNVIYLPLTIK